VKSNDNASREFFCKDYYTLREVLSEEEENRIYAKIVPAITGGGAPVLAGSHRCAYKSSNKS